MSDTEMLDLIEYYNWNINKHFQGWNVYNQNIDIVRPTLREAIRCALVAQAKWSIG